MLTEELRTVFNDYRKTMLSLNGELNFWYSFVSTSLTRFIAENKENREIFGSLFCAYNVDVLNDSQLLACSRNGYSVDVSSSGNSREQFFNWVFNLSILRAYNLLEIVLQEAIRIKWLPTIRPIISSRGAAKNLSIEIKQNLQAAGLKYDSTNNRHLLAFLKSEMIEFRLFCQVKATHGFQASYQEFFELCSILRNIIAHDGMTISLDARNALMSIDKQLFKLYFHDPIAESQLRIIQDKNAGSHHIGAFLHHFNDFAANTIKFIAGEKDFSFLHLT